MAGRYAVKQGGSWKYFAKDGTQLKESYIKTTDVVLWAKTHGGKLPEVSTNLNDYL